MLYIYMKDYVEILKIMLKNNEYDDMIKNLLFKIFDDSYLNRDKMKYNIDNIFKRYNINMYNLLKMKYILTTSEKLLFKKHIYDKREYIIFLLKKNNFISNENESYKSIVDEILKKTLIVIQNLLKIIVLIEFLIKNQKLKYVFTLLVLKKLKITIIVIFIKIKNL